MTSTEALIAKMTVKQIAALGALSASTYQTSREIGFAASTLTSLVNSGLADRRWMSSSYREPDTACYRITGRGIIARNKIAKAI